MDEKVLDEMLDGLVVEAGTMAIENMTKEDLAHLDEPVFEFSKEHEERMKKIIANAGKPEKIAKLEREVKKPAKGKKFQKVMLLAATIILISGLAISSVGAWRESFVKLFLNMKEEYSDVRKEDSPTVAIVDDVYFGYIPNGYELRNKKDTDNETVLNFDNTDKYFVLDIKRNKVGLIRINTEDGIVEEIMVNNRDMVYSENSDMKMLTWEQSSHVLVLMTDTDKEMLMKIAENIKILDNVSPNN